jgi:HK97 family phage major capsid protein
MANAIPLLEGTAASGGFLVPDNFNGLLFERGINRQSALLSMPGLRVRRVNGKREQFTEYVGRPTVATVAEGADKAATGAEYAQVTCDIVKAATVVMYTEELIEDAQDDPTILINQDVRAAFADYIDSNALGRNAAGQIVGSFNSEISESTQTVELANTGGDRVATAVSAAMALVEGNGYNPTGVILAWDARQHFRDARMATETTQQVYGAQEGNFIQPTPTLYGLPIGYTTNLQTLAGAPAAGRVVGIVGDFTHALLAIRNDIRIKFSDQATVNVSGTDHRLWQQNKVASLWEMRLGFVAHDLNRAFATIINAV